MNIKAVRGRTPELLATNLSIQTNTGRYELLGVPYYDGHDHVCYIIEAELTLPLSGDNVSIGGLL